MQKCPNTGLTALVVKKLDHFTLDVPLVCPPGRTLVVTGPSGSGKTTLLRCLAGLEAFDGGYVHFNGLEWNNPAAGLQTAPQSRHLALLSQDFTLFPHMTLARNIRFAMPGPADPSKLMDCMGIGHLRDKRPHEVSGGERQRAALCQALARCPRLLLLDEPFSALDMENRYLLKRYLHRFQLQHGLPIIHVTHDLTEALTNSSDHVIALRHGTEDRAWLERQRQLFYAGWQPQSGAQCAFLAA